MHGKFHVTWLVLLIAGCTEQSSYNRSYVSTGLHERTDYQLGQIGKPGEFSLPKGISLDDGLSEDEAVAIALWNNAQFHADLTALGFARADLIEAQMLSNPMFSLLFPLGPKVLEMALNVPIDILWQRSHRIAATRLNTQSVSENLIEHGLGLIVIGGNRPGQEIEHPMAIVIMGGLVTSTLLNLLFMPALYGKFAKSKLEMDRKESSGLS